jgi:hypothetical protein
MHQEEVAKNRLKVRQEKRTCGNKNKKKITTQYKPTDCRTISLTVREEHPEKGAFFALKSCLGFRG